MNISNVHWINLFLHVTDKRIILILIISLISGTGGTRFKNYRQQWTLAGNNPNWKAQYDTTIDTANMAPEEEHEIVNVLEEYESEDGTADTKTRQNNASHSYSETIDKTGECRNVSGVRRNEIKVSMETWRSDGNVPGHLSGTGGRQVDKIYTGHDGLGAEISADGRVKQERKGQESTRTRTATELFQEQFSKMGTYITELLGEGGKFNQFTVRFKFDYIEQITKNMEKKISGYYIPIENIYLLNMLFVSVGLHTASVFFYDVFVVRVYYTNRLK